MTLVEVDVEPSTAAIPNDVSAFLDAAKQQVARFDSAHSCRDTGFVPSDFVAVYNVLKGLQGARRLPGRKFCELGSGLGVVASLAAMLGYESSGIELRADLVTESRRLASEFGVSVDFSHGSFIPKAATRSAYVMETYLETNREYSWLVATESADEHHQDLAISRQDVVFAYPWPGEEFLFEKLFLEFAQAGSLLIIYSDLLPLSVREKVAKAPHNVSQ